MSVNPMQPRTAEEVRDCVLEALGAGEKIEIRGGGTKADVGRTIDGVQLLDMRALSGVVDYDPAELVLTVLAGTPLDEVKALLEERGQMLAFDPFDHGPLFGKEAGAATIGGVVAAGVAGSQRLACGGARDHILGFRAVSGRGEMFVGGGKVVKNVTGYDLPKIMAGSWGRLAALTELTLKVLPRPPERMTLALRGLDEMAAISAMAKALGSPADVAACAHLPEGEGAGRPLTLIRLQGVGPSVAARAAALEDLLTPIGAAVRLQKEESDRHWHSLTTLSMLGSGPLWRVSVPPSKGAAIAAVVRALDGRWALDWGGGQVWAAFEGGAGELRRAATEAGGHASLIRADRIVRDAVPAFHPPLPGVAALEDRVRRSFDPQGIFETGRF
ncbi:MAG TPA: glycolate oxidase subunit GlcE [Novosphingobium sp.]|nr:glycolate oxidase subunit GlcE [Novosphingobium sp.]